MTHVGMMVLFALLASMVFAALLRDRPADQLRTGGRIFGGFVAGGLLVGWILFGWYG
jgi:hypothetical protein